MRIRAIVPALIVTGSILGGCTTSAPEGVLPRTSVPPPPSVTGGVSKRAAATETAAPAQRRGLDVPNRLVPPSPSSPRP